MKKMPTRCRFFAYGNCTRSNKCRYQHTQGLVDVSMHTESDDSHQEQEREPTPQRTVVITPNQQEREHPSNKDDKGDRKPPTKRKHRKNPRSTNSKTETRHQKEDNTNPKDLINPEEHHRHQRGPHRSATKAPDGHRPHTDLRHQGEQLHHPAAAQAGTEHPDTEMNHHTAAAPEGIHPRDAANIQKTDHLENTAQERPQNQNATKIHQEDVTTIVHHPRREHHSRRHDRSRSSQRTSHDDRSYDPRNIPSTSSRNRTPPPPHRSYRRERMDEDRDLSEAIRTILNWKGYK